MNVYILALFGQNLDKGNNLIWFFVCLAYISPGDLRKAVWNVQPTGGPARDTCLENPCQDRL